MIASTTTQADKAVVIEAARRLIEQGRQMLAAIGADTSAQDNAANAADTDADYAPASWFVRNTLITSDNLRRRRGPMLRAQRAGKRKLVYSRTDARQLWPDLFVKPLRISRSGQERTRADGSGNR